MKCEDSADILALVGNCSEIDHSMHVGWVLGEVQIGTVARARAVRLVTGVICDTIRFETKQALINNQCAL